jgi:hypothetical protein
MQINRATHAGRPVCLSCFYTGIGFYPEFGRVDNGVRELIATGATEQSTIIVSIASNGGQLHLGWLSTPLTTAATRGRVYGNGLAEFIMRHQVSSLFVLTVHHKQDHEHV